MRYIALLRGINVGGNTMIKMERLREVFSSLGFENVKSYINSGNLAFDVKKSDDNKLAAKIRSAIKTEFGLDIPVMVRTLAEIKKVVKDNPFDGQFADPKSLHVFFLTDCLSAENKRLLMEKTSDEEKIAVRGREIYYLLRISVVDSILGKGFIDKKLKVPATARNWRTVNKLIEL
jgi:uncharacterized protein (DUF1697 family)